MSAGRRPWLPGAATALAALSCYGTTAAIALLSALGVSIAVDGRIWAGAISLFAAAAAIATAAGYRRHRAIGPSLLAAGGLAAILWAMYGSYSGVIELAGFLALAAAAAWDWRSRAARPAAADDVVWIEPDAVFAARGRGGPKLIDVRGPDEFGGELGHIEGAMNIPLDALPGRLTELASFRNESLALVCRTQMRSAKAAGLLREAGFPRVSVLRGGMQEWNRRGLPIAGATRPRPS